MATKKASSYQQHISVRSGSESSAPCLHMWWIFADFLFEEELCSDTWTGFPNIPIKDRRLKAIVIMSSNHHRIFISTIFPVDLWTYQQVMKLLRWVCRKYDEHDVKHKNSWTRKLNLIIPSFLSDYICQSDTRSVSRSFIQYSSTSLLLVL